MADKHYQGQCHCGSVRFAFQGPETLELLLCNCSICRMTGFQHVIVPQAEVTLQGADNLTTYTFNTGTAKHTFCKTCGVKPLYIPRSHPDCYSINARCIDEGLLGELQTQEFDGRNWEQARADLND